MASFDVKGKILHIAAPENVTDSFRKRELIIEIDGDTQYPNTIKFEAVQAKCDDNFFSEARVGDEATISFNLRGNVYDNKAKNKKEVFNSLQFWKGQLNRTTAAAPQQQAAPVYAAPVDISQRQDDDLPF